MNNAIASKQQLNLAVGVSLNSQQVAALTHDIVWLEEHEVNGEKVLVPVLYMAQADNRLGPTGALIAGNDVSLIAGQNLDNVGTLRAANNLSAVAGNNLINTGLIEAGNRLDLLAGNDLINTAGGIIKGRDVSLTSINGDVINERSITSMDNSARGQRHNEFADSAARIEAANDMSISAGRDFINKGSELESGRDMSIQAGRDVTIAPTEVTNSLFSDSKHNSSDITQLGSTASSGRDLTVQAGRDISVIASQIDAKRDIAMAATENLTISSAADEEHSLSKSKKLTRQEDHVSQVSSDLDAGGSVALQAGQNLAVISSRITAGKEAYLVAGENLDILAAQDSDYSLYDKKKKGSFGAKKTKRDEITDVKNVGSEITTGGDLLLASGGDQKYQAAKLESGKDLTIESGGAVTFEGVKDLKQESHEKSKSDLAWNSSKGKGNTDETLRQSELVAKGEVAIRAVEGLKIDIKQVDQQSVSQTIDAMVKADPQLAWLKEAEQRGDVDWRQIKEVHDSFKYNNSSLGQGAMLAVIIIVTALTAGAGTFATAGAAAGSAANGAALAAGISGTTAATIGTAVNVAVVAGLTSATSQAVISTVNNKGNLGAALKDVTSAESMKGYLVSGLAAGFAAGILDSSYGVSPEHAAKATHGFDLGSVDGFTNYAGYTLAQGGFSAAANTAINGGGLTDNLAQAAISSAADVMSAGIYNKLGTQLEFSGLPSKLAAHALVGGLIAELAGGDFRSGALAAGANEAFVNMVGDKIFVEESHEKLLAMTSQLIGLTVAAAAGGTDKDQAVAGWVAQQATTFNYLEHSEKEAFIKEMLGCDTDKCARDKWEEGKFDEDSQGNVQYANDIAGSPRARMARDRILDSLGSILDMNCPTSACEGYKQLLVKRSLDTLGAVNQVIKDWSSVDQKLGLMAGAALGPKPATTAALQPAEALALTRVQKAVDYLQGAKAAVNVRSASFADEAKLIGHFEKHGAEFGAKSSIEYLQVGKDIMQGGDKVQYLYKGEVRTGYVQFMGNSSRGDAKYGFVGTNSDGAITTIHVESGKSFWKMLNGDPKDKIIRPVP
ncbi:DUF637 domain-containing protein [Pseudomonas syringae]|uniref:DUF637 domain-containing protein n=1 Tax=Pseudomonas syringae TaxID=317 RepID=UPI002FCD70B6